jgi:steroid 5-alpha reductase family enzyme
MIFRGIVSALGTLVMRSVPALAAATVVGFWTGWFERHPAYLAALIGWFGLLLVEIWIEYRRWKAKRNSGRAP